MCNDTVERTISWLGKIGLVYPPDYGYATSGGSTANLLSSVTIIGGEGAEEKPYELSV